MGPIQPNIQLAPVLFPLLKRPASEDNHPPAPGAEIKNGWSYTSITPIRVNGVDRDAFTINYSYSCQTPICTSNLNINMISDYVTSRHVTGFQDTKVNTVTLRWNVRLHCRHVWERLELLERTRVPFRDVKSGCSNTSTHLIFQQHWAIILSDNCSLSFVAGVPLNGIQ